MMLEWSQTSSGEAYYLRGSDSTQHICSLTSFISEGRQYSKKKTELALPISGNENCRLNYKNRRKKLHLIRTISDAETSGAIRRWLFLSSIYCNMKVCLNSFLMSASLVAVFLFLVVNLVYPVRAEVSHTSTLGREGKMYDCPHVLRERIEPTSLQLVFLMERILTLS